MQYSYGQERVVMNLCVEHGGLLVKLFPVSTTTSLRMFLPGGAFLGEGGREILGRAGEGLWLSLPARLTRALTKDRKMWGQHSQQMGQRLPPMGSGRNHKAGAMGSTTGSPRRATEGQTTSARDSWDPGPAEEQAVRAAHMAAVTCRTFCMH